MRFGLVVTLWMICVFGYKLRTINDAECHCILTFCLGDKFGADVCQGPTCETIVNETLPDPNACDPIIFELIIYIIYINVNKCDIIYKYIFCYLHFNI